jgi:uncharacterized protein (TIGR03067 family)
MMNRRTFLTFAGATIMNACATPNPNRALVGTWALTSAQLGGQEFPLASINGAALHLSTDAYEFSGDRGSYITVPHAKPAQLDIYGVQGPNAGRTILAIYEMHGDDEMVVCYQLGAGQRPTAFASPEGTQLFLVHYKRVAQPK